LQFRPGVSRFAVSVVSPQGYVHSAAFREVAESLHHGLVALGHDSLITDSVRPPGRRPIILGSNLLKGVREKPPKDAVLYNLEQIDPGSPWLTPDLLELFRRHTVWDYSPRNAERYRALGLPAPRVVPIGWVPALTRIAPAAEEDIDVLFYGSVNPRRRRILDALAARGLRVEAAYGLYGEARDQLIARAKIVLNVHFYEAKVFEVVRVSYLLANRRCVVSERGVDPLEERRFEAGVAFAPYDDLVDTCLRLARDPVARASLAAAGHGLMKRRDTAAYLREALGGAPAVDAPAAPEPSAPVSPLAPTRSEPMNLPLTPPLSLEDVLAMTEPRGKRILDVACGDGQVGSQLLMAGAAEVVGLDPCARTLTRSRLTAVFAVDADAAPELPYPDGYFDVVLVEDLSRLLVPGPTLQHLRRWLSDQGRLVVVAMNAGHEAALASLLIDGRFSADAGARAITPGVALDAIAAAGFQVEQDVILQRTEAGEAAAALKQAAVALGADAERVADGLTLARVLLAARPQAAGRAQPEALPDPWQGSKPLKVLLAPDVRGDPNWISAAQAVGKGLEGNSEVTLGIALPASLLEAPPPALQHAMEGLRLDVLLTEAPTDVAGWQRMVAGASTVMAPPPDRLALARLVGVDVQVVG
jgi:SAM-dependent methyltransferase